MKNQTSILVHTFLTLSCIGIIFNPISPGQAASCRSTQTVGSIDFGNCQSITLIGGGTSSNAQYKIRQSTQFNVAITAYNNTIAANITQLQVAKTLAIWKLKTGDIELVSLAIPPSNLDINNYDMTMLAENTNSVAITR